MGYSPHGLHPHPQQDARPRVAFGKVVISATLWGEHTTDHTWLNVAWSGGQEHGILIGWPFAPFTAPSQSPVPKERYTLSAYWDGDQGLKPTGRILTSGEAKLGC